MCALALGGWLAVAFYGPRAWSADKPYAIPFAAEEAAYVRLVIHASSGGEPCIDELEVYGPDSETNLALAECGAEASASSCLAGYRQHAVPHLNDGVYGNDHSWIAASTGVEWAQVKLPAPALVARVVISRDRARQYRDRVPVVVEVQLSQDGTQWRSVARAERPAPRADGYLPPAELPDPMTWDGLLEYAFRCERATWQRMSPDDHLSPLQVERPAVPGGGPYWGRLARLQATERVIVLFEEMIERLHAAGLDVEQERCEAAELRQRDAAVAASAEGTPAADQLYFDARRAKRRLFFRDPALTPIQQVLFVKRHPLLASHNYSDVLDSQYRPGGGICVLHVPCDVDGRLDPEHAQLQQLVDASAGIARDPVADYDAQTVYFAYRRQTPEVTGWESYWHLMSVDVRGQQLTQLTHGPFHDFDPLPLPDGGVAFCSTRCKARFLCWRPQAYVLFRMQADGSDIEPLSFANLSEWTPSMMRDGRILWTRSEYLDKGADFGHTLWAIRPDGTHPELIFGNNTPNCYIHAREVPDTTELVCTLFSHGGDHNGPIGLIDLARRTFDPGRIVTRNDVWGQELYDPAAPRLNSEAVTNITPDVRPHYNMSWARYECFRDPMPVSRDHFLVSHAPADLFGLYVIDRYGNRELLYLDPAMGSMSPQPLQPRVRPPILAGARDPELASAGLGRFTVTDVYRGLEGFVPRGAAKYLRVVEERRAELAQLPTGEYRRDYEPFQDYYATPVHHVSGPAGWPSFVAKGVWGTTPVAEDGSADFLAPAGKVLYFQLLDGELNELQRMRSVVQVQPGEHRSCIGCHEDRRAAPAIHEPLALRHPPRQLDAPPWGAGAFSYEQVVQPVWDAHCVSCHAGTPDAPLDLRGTRDAQRVPVSFRGLIEGGWVDYFDWTWSLQHYKAQPLSFGTLRSRLWDVLRDANHAKVQLSRDELHAIKAWIDLNCPLWPDYTNRLERGAPLAAR
jgi:hypothetical protein